MLSNESRFKFNCEGQSYETVHKPQPLWGERRAKAELSRGPSAYKPNALLLGQTGSLLTVLMYCMDVSMYVICIGCRRLVVHTQKEWMTPGSWNLCFCVGNRESDCCSGCCQSKGCAHYTYTKYSHTDLFMLTQITVTLICLWMPCVPVWKRDSDCCGGFCQSKGESCTLHLQVHLQPNWFVHCTHCVPIYTCVMFKRNVWSLISILLLVLHTKCLKYKCKIAAGWSGLN